MAFCVSSSHKPLREISPDIVKFMAQAYVEAINTDNRYGHSSDSRFLLQFKFHLEPLSKEMRRELSEAACKALDRSMKFIDSGGRLAHYHFLNLSMVATVDDFGVEHLRGLIKRYPSRFEGEAPFAQVLLEKGHVKDIQRIFRHRNCHNYNSWHFRIRFTKFAEEKINKVISSYAIDERPYVFRFLYLPRKSLSKDSPVTTDSEAGKRLAKLLLEADPEFLHKAKYDDEYGLAFRLLDSESIMMLKGYFKDYPNIYTPQFFIGKKGDRMSRSDERKLRAVMRLAVAEGNVEFIKTHLEGARELLKTNKNKISYKHSSYLNEIAQGFYTGIYHMFGTGEHDEHLVKLLPVSRDLTKFVLASERKASYHKGGKWHQGKNLAYMLMPYIHDELNQMQPYEEWFSSLPQKFKGSLIGSVQHQPFMFMKENYVYEGEDRKESERDVKPLILRVLNNKRFQKFVLFKQEGGGCLDYMVDLRYVSPRFALEILQSGEIKAHYPELQILLNSEISHMYGKMRDYELMKKHAVEAVEQSKDLSDEFTLLKIKCRLRASCMYLLTDRIDLAESSLPNEWSDSLSPTHQVDFNDMTTHIKRHKEQAK